MIGDREGVLVVRHRGQAVGVLVAFQRTLVPLRDRLRPRVLLAIRPGVPFGLPNDVRVAQLGVTAVGSAVLHLALVARRDVYVGGGHRAVELLLVSANRNRLNGAVGDGVRDEPGAADDDRRDDGRYGKSHGPVASRVRKVQGRTGSKCQGETCEPNDIHANPSLHHVCSEPYSDKSKDQNPLACPNKICCKRFVKVQPRCKKASIRNLWIIS